MKNIRKIFFSIILLGLFMVPANVNAAAKHGIGLRAYKCPMDDYASESGDDKYYACMEDYLDGNLSTYEVSDSSNVDPGTVLLLVLDYYIGQDAEVVALNTFINYDTSVWEADLSEDGELISDYESTNYPKAGRKVTWSFNASIKSPGVISVLAADTDNYKELPDDTEMGYIIVKMKDDAQPGKTTSFNFNTTGAKMSDADGKGLPYDITNLNLSVYGAESHDATLGSLAVKNGSTTYPLDPSFDSDKKIYSTVVPANVGQITLEATAHDEKGTVTPGTIGTKNIATGVNNFTITVTSEFGNIENYNIEVYRLSDDATLKSLSLDNIDIGTFSSNNTSYSANVLYHVSSTDVSAEVNDPLATIYSGDGSWTFIDSKNETLNTRNILVKAEDCKEEYKDVPGNGTCTTKTYTINVTRGAASTNNYLSSLKVDGVSVPNFNQGTFTYTLSNAANSKTKMNITAEIADIITLDNGSSYKRAKIVSGTGEVNLAVGDNSYDIVVEAENGSRKTYTINVRRLSNDTSLANLTVTSNPQGTLATDISNSDSHTYTYDPTVTQITVSAVVNDTNKAKISIADVTTNASATGTSVLNSISQTYNISTTKVMITVTAEDGTIKNYPVNLTRLKSSNNYLSSLSLSDGTLSPTFTSTIRTYSAYVDGSVENVTVNAVPAVEYASVKSITGNTNLKFGNNTIEVIVKAENGDEASYIINLERKKYTIATLDSLTVDNVSVPGFDKNKFEYRLEDVAFTKTSVNVAMTKTNSYSTVTGTGDISLKTGENTIKVKVVSHDGNTINEYVIKIYREKNSDNSVHGLTVSGVTPTLKEGSTDTYEVTLPNGKSILNPSDVIVSISSDATIDKDASINLVTDDVNTYKFRITNENGDEKEYTILITREPSNDTSISKVTLTIGTDSSRYCLMEGTSCKISVPVETTNFSLSAIVHEKARISPINGTSYDMPANESIKNVPLTVTAEDGTIKNYTVVVERQKSSNNNLSSLVVKNGTTIYDLSPVFSSGQLTYNVTVPGLIDKVNVEASVEDTGKASILTDLSESFNLTFGSNNKIEVKVKAENNQEKTYTVFVTRSKGIDATLKDLKVNGTTIQGFDPTITSYTLSDVDFNTTQLNIVATPNDDLASKIGDGLVSLKTGNNTITITVSAHDTSVTKPYVIKVYREKNSDNSVHGLTVAGVTPTLREGSTDTYEVTLPNSKTTLLPNDVNVTISSDATIDKDSSINLVTENVNTYKFRITNENGDEKEYTILVTREPSNDTSISKVTLTIGTDSSRYCLMEGTSCKILVPVETTNFSLSAIVHEKASVIPTNGTNFDMPANESLKNITLTVTAEDGTIKNYTVVVERQKSSNNNLSSLVVKNGETVYTLNPTFSSTQLTYNVTVPGLTDKVNIEATVEDTGKASIITDLSEPFNLTFGSNNKIEIKVKAENKQEKTYTVFITRSKGIDATLKDLTINGTTIQGFDPTVTNYTLSNVDYNTHQLYIVATPNDDLATKSGDGLVSLKTGDNTITIMVTAHDTSVTKPYTINVNRALSSNTNITGISLAGNEATCDFDYNKCSVTVPNSVDEANSTNLIVNVASPIASGDALAQVSFENTSLDTTKLNSIEITVIAEDLTEMTYTLEVTREKSNVATLDSLTVTNGAFNPSFNTNKFDYDVTIPVTASEFDVAAVLTEEHANITSGTGHYTLADNESGKVVEIVIVSQDLSVTKKYTLNISRTKSSINTLKELIVSEGTLSPEFDPDITTYSVNVSGSTEEIDVNAVVTDNSRANIISGIGTHSLQVGNNEIKVRVRSESNADRDYVITVNRAKKENNNLASLTVDGVLVPNFDPAVLEYTLENVAYTKTNIEIAATKEDVDATIVSGTGKKGLKTGNNTFEVVVNAQNGTPKTYKINIYRTKNDNAYLKSLSVSGYSISFNKTTLEYEITVSENKEKLLVSEVTAIKEDSNATLIEPSSDLELSTEVDNFYEVTVVSEDGLHRNTYSIKVNRPKSSDTDLLSVTTNNTATISPSFNKDRESHTYTITVPYGQSTFTIDATPNNAKTKVIGKDTYPSTTDVVTLTTIAENGNIGIYTFNVVQAQSNDATLNNLKVSGYNLDKAFSSIGLNYNIGLIPYETNKLAIEATPSNANSTIEYYVDSVKQTIDPEALIPQVNIPNDLNNHVIKVVVTAPDKVTTKTYNITYKKQASDNAYLLNIEPSHGTIDFNKTTTYYEISVANDIESISFHATAEDANAIISSNGSQSFSQLDIVLNNLEVGNNQVDIVVTAQNETSSNTYTVVVKRQAPVLSDDANLSSLSVENYTISPEFDMDNLEYSIGTIPYGVTQLTVNATLNIGTSSIKYSINGLSQSSNVITVPKVEGSGAINVQVTAEDGTTKKNYKITYVKSAPSSNTDLSNIVVSEGTLDFNPSNYEYTVNVENDVNSIDVTSFISDPLSQMKMNGVICSSPHTLTISPLSTGNTKVIIIVTAENGDSATYTVTVNKASSNPNEIITSNIYGHVIEDGYIKTVAVFTTVSTLINDQLDNDAMYLEVWNADETTKIGLNEDLATGMIVKLIINGVEKDRKIIVIKGDTSGDGEVDLFDAVKILRHDLGYEPLINAYLVAGDVDDDGEVDLFDAVKILRHDLGYEPLY